MDVDEREAMKRQLRDEIDAEARAEAKSKAMKRQLRQEELAGKRSLNETRKMEYLLKLSLEQLPERQLAGKRAHQGYLLSIKQAGYVFCPSDVTLISYYLMGNGRYEIKEGPIWEDPNLFNKHPRDLLAGKSEARYFFTTSQPNEDGNRQWIAGEKTDVIRKDQTKVGDKQVYEYCERDHKSKYKLILYQVDPPLRQNNVGPNFDGSLCKVYEDTSCAYGS